MDIHKKKKLRDLFTGLAFLAPNFVGFLIFTVLPLLATIAISFTDWDGISKFAPAKGSVKFVISEPRSKDVVIPAGTEFVLTLRKVEEDFVTGEKKQVNKEVKYLTKEEAVIPKGEVESSPVKVVCAVEGTIGNAGKDEILGAKLEEGFKGVGLEVVEAFDGGTKGAVWVGLANYKKLFHDHDYGRYLLNTLIFLIEIPLGMAVSLILALAMNQKLKGIVVFRTMFFMPVISSLVAVALLWRWIFNEHGLLNSVLISLGVSHPPAWLGEEWPARIAIIIMDVWKGAGYNMMLYLAALQNIPKYLYEAADIDGANGWQKFWNITFPLLGPTNFFIVVMGLIGGLQAFTSQFVMTGGGPAGATTTIVYYIYMNAYQWYKMGYATAMAVSLLVMTLIVTIIQFAFTEGKVEYNI